MIESVTLGSLIRPAGHRAQRHTHLPVYSVTKHRGFVPSLEYFNKQVFGKDLSSYKVVAPGEFAFATIHLDEGSIGVCPEPALISPMYTVFSSDDSKVDGDFLIRFLKSPIALAQYGRLGRGTAERRKSISLEALGRVRIPLPPLPEQRLIAETLDQVDALRARRRLTIARLQDLISVAFSQLESGPSVRMALKAAGVGFSSGKSVTGLDEHDLGGLRVAKVSAVSSGRFDLRETKPLPSGYVPPETYRIRPGDLLMTRASGSLDLIGVPVVVPPFEADVYLPDKLWRVDLRSDAMVTPAFLTGLFRSPGFRSFVRNEASGASGVKNISQEKVLNFVAKVPKISDQLRFADEMAVLARAIELDQNHLAKLDELFDSLQYRAFRGEL